MEDKYRMYGLVPYNISPIQQAIQFGHAVVEYGLDNFEDPVYQEWAKNNKTFIILNGGTTNSKVVFGELETCVGTLNQHLATLQNMGIKVATFCEPDLGDQLTAVVFIVPCEVYNKNQFPDFEKWKLSNVADIVPDDTTIDAAFIKLWADSIGGQKNADLRAFLDNFRLA